MAWSEIKHALNSRLGTSNMKSLDAMIDEVISLAESSKSNTATNNTANATGTLSQKLTYIASSLLGTTDATGGSTTAGTVMAKLNALLTSWTSTRAGYLDNLNNRLTSTRAGYLDYLANSTYGLSAIKTAVNGVADKHYAPSSTVLQNLGFTTTKATTSLDSTSSSDYARTCIKASDNFIPKANGVVNVSGTVNLGWTYSGNGTDATSSYYYVAVIALGSNSDTPLIGRPHTTYGYTNAISASSKAKGTKLQTNVDTSDAFYNAYDTNAAWTYSHQILKSQLKANGSSSETFSIDIPVEKGYPLFVLLETYTRGNNGAKLTATSIVLTQLQIKAAINNL